ncbi:putative taxadiene 5-alpha-hydroxylase [Helianthus annuus]|uniref:Taxadiene 5-alpha-hydroxylase n=2 Tax=Helianthus annuus TaxID=4232 RepID=A0A9K3GSM2_HELAN|nr:taxadiene 5-alpha hydroxylase [Helianthus annuus]KAF5754347.1 putative taxadiene 5-alpha-hydroxylase [Helianthus annuus]KAJ0432308.1 putative taxadiene 5-alpha-hydroxylase [Helianthus annuus]KAJ0635424.1 putative taxadiene 5-alpha-hydroxylase [Helianthus annuus]KAJ0812114.1 putative taxadiene 5-alpha-hydroxylase [Helianthus annuus]
MVSFIFSLLPLFFFIMFLIYKTWNQAKHYTKIPSGRMGLPWIGETIGFYRAQRSNQLFENFFQPRINKHGKIFKTKLMGSPTVVVNGAAANKFFMSNEFKLVISSWPTSSVELMGKNSIMEKQGDSHRCLRGIIASTLSPTGLPTMVPRMCRLIRKHLMKNWGQRDEMISLHRSTKVLTFAIVLECLFGIRIDADTMFGVFENVLEGVMAAPINLPGTKFSSAKKARAKIQKALVDEVQKKKEAMEAGGRDEDDAMLLSNLVAALIRGEVTEDEVVDNIVLLVFAAHDTTSYAITMMFKMLANHPDCYTLLLKEHEDIAITKRREEDLTLEDVKKMEYTWQVARETMRLCPPIFGSFRKATADIEFEGFIIPKGWKVLWTAYGTHYNEEYFPDPMSFNPSRFADPVQAYAFIPFGGGPRLCAGYQLAKLNILVFMHYVVTRYDWSLVYPDEPVVMDPLPFPSKGMPIKISPKHGY